MHSAIPASIVSALLLIGVYILAKYFSILVATDLDRRSYLGVAFPAIIAIIDDGLEFIVVGGLGLVGVGSGTALVDEDASTLRLIGWHVVLCFMSFYLARVLSSGYLFYVLVFIGMFCRFAIVGIITFHFCMPHLEVLPVIVAPLFTLLLVSSHRLSPCLRGYLPFLRGYRVQSGSSCPSHDTFLQRVVTVGFKLTAFGLGLLGVGTWAKLAEKSPNLHGYLALYYGVAFWCFYSAQILGRGVIYEICVWLGIMAEIGMFLTSALYVLFPHPAYELPVLMISFSAATLTWNGVVYSGTLRAVSRPAIEMIADSHRLYIVSVLMFFFPVQY